MGEQNRHDPLNTRELEIVGLMFKGLSNSEIALKLHLSLETIKWYNKQLFSKLGVGSRAQAVAKAVETGILAAQATPQIRKEPRPAQNLPAPITSFIGRENEIQQVETLVARARLVTITGSGGVGKTRLAIQVASRLTSSFNDGIYWIPLAALSDATASQKREHSKIGPSLGEELVILAIAKALRISDMSGLPLLQGVLDNLRDRQILLVIDNCEHLIEACAVLVERLLNDCPMVTIFTTSREALGVPGEKAWRLPSLSLPPLTSAPGEEAASNRKNVFQSEAVSLFIERAGDVLPDYKPAISDTSIIAHICQRLDGIPLAIELAAARMNLLTVQEIAARLDRRFSMLTGGHRTALPRHQTLRAAIEWSYELLNETEQALFRRLSIFAGSFTLEAAEAVCAIELPIEEVLTLLGRLVDKSLLNVEPAPQRTDLASRYRFLDTIRSLGRLKLEEIGEIRRMRDRHADYYVRLAETVGPELLLKNQVHWYKLLQAENDNLRAVIEWSIESNQAEIGLRVAGALLWFWWSHGSSREGRDLTLKTLALQSANQDNKLRARALNTAGYLHWVVGEFDLAIQKIEEAISILGQSNDKASLAWSKQIFAMVLSSKGEYDLADKAMKEGVAVSQSLGDYHSGVFSLAFQGDIAMQRGDLSKARKIYEDSADLLRAFGNMIFLAYPVRRLGYLHLEQNNSEQALDCFRQSLDLNQEVGDKRAVFASIIGIATVAVRLDKPVLAARLVGAVASQLYSLSIILLPLDEAESARIHSQLLTILDQATFASAFAEGWEMSEEQAIALVKEIK